MSCYTFSGFLYKILCPLPFYLLLYLSKQNHQPNLTCCKMFSVSFMVIAEQKCIVESQKIKHKESKLTFIQVVPAWGFGGRDGVHFPGAGMVFRSETSSDI